MNWLRVLVMGKWWYFVGRAFGMSSKQRQRCDLCGRIPFASWWDETNSVWLRIAGNVNGNRHGCFCIGCFTRMASTKGIHITWKPEVRESDH